MSLLIGVLIMLIATGHCFNQPKFASDATWNINATTLGNESLVGQYPTGMFVSATNRIYVSERASGRVLVWGNRSLAPEDAIRGNSSQPWSVFVVNDSEIYVDNGHEYGRIDRWTVNSAASELVMNITSPCTGLFVDLMSDLYCSSAAEHRVYKLERRELANAMTVIAGTGCPGPVANMLDHPYGIFVDENFTLFVADSHNNRVQLFQQGFVSGTTVAAVLNRPTSVTVDGDGNLYIVDSGNHRIIQLLAGAVQCLFGCEGVGGSGASQLKYPHAMAFDTDGNVLVTDLGNRRVQKFSIMFTATSHQPLPSQCFDYQLITDGTRHYSYDIKGQLYDMDGPMTDTGSWFRFSGAAGTILANFVVSLFRCNADIPGWFNGQYPTEQSSTISGSVCYNWAGNACFASNNVSVTQCDGYYVFFLTIPPTCYARYCTA